MSSARDEASLSIKVVASVVLALFIFLSGCAATKLTDADEKQIKNVAIISLVSERVNLQKVGLTVFNNERTEIDLGGKISATVESVSIKRIATTRPNWSVKHVDYDREALIRRMKSSGMVIAYSEEKIEKELADLAQSNGLDALFVISSQKYENIPGDGVGIWLRTLSLSSIGRALIHSNVDLKVVGPRGNVIARGFGSPESPKPIDPAAYGIVYELKDNLRPELVSRLSEEIVRHLAISINKRFDQLGL